MTADELLFFEGSPGLLALYGALLDAVRSRVPGMGIKVHKTQIDLTDGRAFAYVSRPRRGGKGRLEPCITVTFGLAHRVTSPRIAYAAEPYPNRWTHHVPVSDADEIDGELLGWIGAAHAFMQSKRRRPVR